MRCWKIRSVVGVGVGVLALAMMQAPEVKAQSFAWHGPTMTIATGVTGNPSLVQAKPGTYGTMGNYELVTPLSSGGIGHFFRDNDDPALPWSGPFTFATDQGAVGAVSLIQSNFSTQFVNTGVQGPGNLAVVARIGNTLDYFFRDDVNFAWSGGPGQKVCLCWQTFGPGYFISAHATNSFSVAACSVV
jgi:hypothetical protein